MQHRLAVVVRSNLHLEVRVALVVELGVCADLTGDVVDGKAAENVRTKCC